MKPLNKFPMKPLNKSKFKSLLKSVRGQLSVHVGRNGWSRDNNRLHAMCGISSYILFKLFKEMGESPTFCMNDGHCFIKNRSYIIDLTLPQFNVSLPSIFYRKTPTKHHKIKETAKTDKKLKRLFKNWPKEQNPFKKKLPKIKLEIV